MGYFNLEEVVPQHLWVRILFICSILPNRVNIFRNLPEVDCWPQGYTATIPCAVSRCSIHRLFLPCHSPTLHTGALCPHSRAAVFCELLRFHRISKWKCYQNPTLICILSVGCESLSGYLGVVRIVVFGELSIVLIFFF